MRTMRCSNGCSITERLPAWSSNRLNRLIRLPKRYLVDPAFVGPLLGVDARAVLRDVYLLQAGFSTAS